MTGTVHDVVSGGSTRAAFELAWGACTDTGKVRRHNEDAFVVDAGLFVVADGMGGHRAGDVASGIVADICREAAGGVPMSPGAVSSLIDAANGRVFAEAHEIGAGGMGTTVVGAVVVDNGGDESVVVFNVGDSRCYLFDPAERLRQLTRDHSVVQELIDAGELSPSDAARHADRNVVTRAVGIEPSVAADYFVVPVPAGRSLRMLLCSDGVSGQVDEATIERLLSGNESPADAAAALVAAVLDGPAPDNATAVVVDVVWVEDDSEAVDDDGEITGPRPTRPGSDPSTEITGPRPVRASPDLIDAVPIAESSGRSAPVPTIEITEVPS